LFGGFALARISTCQSLHRFSNVAAYVGLKGDLNIDERLVEDLITACRSVAAKLDALKSITDNR
jgi:hypothetical protein